MKALFPLVALLVIALALASCGDAAADPAGSDGGAGSDDGNACKIEAPDCGDPVPVEEALATGSDDAIAVQGFVVVDSGGARLCEALAESFPPQCGGANLTIGNPDSIPDFLAFPSEQGVTWSDNWVTLEGALADGVLTIR